jgi:NAD(P)-dependent dehydrogenase (short-subunit alcohol dehydrogenase family)
VTIDGFSTFFGNLRAEVPPSKADNALSNPPLTDQRGGKSEGSECMQDLEEVSALVSGAASAVGSEIVRELVSRGAKVLAADSSEELVDEAIARLGLDNADEIFTHALEGCDLVSWWDLANLIAAYLPSLNLFVHVAEEKPPVPVRTLNESALSDAQAVSTASLLTAVARLEKYLIVASEEDAIGACVVAVLPAADDDAIGAVPGAVCHASTQQLTSALSTEYSETGRNIRVHAIRPSASDARGAATEVVELLGR